MIPAPKKDEYKGKVFTIFNQLTLTGLGSDNKGNVFTRYFVDPLISRWTIERTRSKSRNVYRIRNVATNMLLGVRSDGTVKAAEPASSDETDFNQEWTITTQDDKASIIKNKNLGTLLSVDFTGKVISVPESLKNKFNKWNIVEDDNQNVDRKS